MIEELIIPLSGNYTKDGKRFMNGNCLIHVEVEVEPHGTCRGGRGILIVPLQAGKTPREAAFKCQTCSQTVFRNVLGICL